MGEILSHAEIEAILTSIHPSPAIQPVSPFANPAVEHTATWERHDFRNVEPLRGSTLQIVHALQSRFGEQSKTRLQALLQSRVEIHPVGTCQTTSAEFLGTLPYECTICDLAVAESQPESLLVWGNPLLSPLFSKMLGGGHDDDNRKPVRQELTSIERRLLSKLNDVLLTELADFVKLKLVVTGIHDRIASVPGLPPVGAAIWLSFDIDCGDTRGAIHLGLSRALFGAIDTSRTNSVTVKPESRLAVESLPTGIQKVMVEVSANLANLRMRTSDVASLQVGDILMTDLQYTDPVSLRLEDQTLCLATVGTHTGKKALRLVQTPLRR